MDLLVETVDLDIEESNELAFKIKLEGASASPAKVRLVCEGSDFSYMFNGYGTNEDEVVQFTIPQMSNKIKEGIYLAKVEVLVENRYFSPLQFQINFKKTISVVAESIQIVPKTHKPDIRVTAAPIQIQKQPVQQTSTIKFEQKPTKQIQESPAEENKFSLRDVYLRNLSSGTLKEKFKK
jgi:hypothetical protein